MEQSHTGASHLVDLVRCREQADRLAEALLPSRRAIFGGVSLPMPDIDGQSELAFIRMANWLYVHYFEVGNVSVRFLVRRGSAKPQGRNGEPHLDVVHALRTYFGHNLDVGSESDAAIANTCGDWFDRHCRTRVPRTDAHWRVLCDALVAEASQFLIRLRDLVGDIETDEDRPVIVQQWEDRLNRNWPAHRYHSLIAIVAADLGRDAVDPVAFFQRYGSAISDGMRILSQECDFELEARRLIERSLLSEVVSVLPITGIDIMRVFAITAGKEVGKMLQQARSIYEADPCDGETLLKRIAENRIDSNE